jgi:tetratricopeptide (TPR) repeat protein
MGDNQTRHPPVIAGFDLSHWERPFAVALGLGILAFDFYQWNSRGSSNLAFAAFICGVVLILIGIVGLDWLSRVTRLSVAPTGAVLIETAEATRVQVQESGVAAPVAEEPTPMAGQEEVTGTLPGADTEEKSPLQQAIDAYYIDKDYARFDELMRQAVSEASEEGESVNLESIRLGLLYEVGQGYRLEALEALRSKHPTSSYPVRALARCYASAGEHLTAAKLYGEGYKIEGLSQGQRLIFLGQQAMALKDAKHFEEAEALLTNEFQRVDEEKEQAEVHKHLAALYEAWGRKAQMGWHLEKVLEVNPGDGARRFKLAYSYAEDGHPHAALYHYDLITSTNTGAGNNMALVLEKFDMPITAAAYYRGAAREKNTLSAANLAQTMIQAGLVDEAEHLLNEAMKEENVHERVHRMVARMAEDKDEEEKRLEKIREGARVERQLLRERVEAEHKSTGPIKGDDVVGTWSTSVGDMTFKGEGDKLTATSKDGYWDWVATGAIEGRTYSFEWKCDRPGQNKEGDGFFVFASDDRFQGLVRHVPQKGEIRLVTGTGKESPGASTASGTTDELDELLRSPIRDR